MLMNFADENHFKTQKRKNTPAMLDHNEDPPDNYILASGTKRFTV